MDSTQSGTKVLFILDKQVFLQIILLKINLPRITIKRQAPPVTKYRKRVKHIIYSHTTNFSVPNQSIHDKRENVFQHVRIPLVLDQN